MKKDKKEKEVKSKVKMNKIQKLAKLLNVGEIMLMAIPIFRLGLILVMAVLGVLGGEKVSLIQISQELFGKSETVFATTFDQIYYTTSIILSCIGYVVNILIINRIKKIFINLDEDKTPFTEKNIKLLDQLKGYALYSFITIFLGNEYGMNIIPVVVVLGLISIFKYGIELQKEVDETL